MLIETTSYLFFKVAFTRPTHYHHVTLQVHDAHKFLVKNKIF